MPYYIRALDDPDGFKYGGATLKEVSPTPGTGFITNSVLGQNSLYFQPFDLVEAISANRLNLFLSVATTISNGNSTGRGGYTISAALYTRGTGTATDRMSRMWSASAPLSISMTSNTAISVTNIVGIKNSTAVSTTQHTVQNANASTYVRDSVGGYRALALPVSSFLPPGRYWLAVANSSTSSNAGVCMVQCSVLQQTNNNAFAYKPFGTSSGNTNAGFGLAAGGAGTYTVTSGAFPATVALTTNHIATAGTAVLPYFNLSNAAAATNSP